ncbi:hypothetical protein L1987_67389 [Smallanthus sonchifolius]|uniref:Uncharacterized protein n=1 Tax=Smallanthus sonchifolius TaxID=185202 RepID=A0ACB9B4F4_9ASTR|nr:hypothetical protein L1987_67389 [Smallanthus sonchifolius]
MRSPSKSVTKRIRDAESELNLPPGFRFHPTDEELIGHYLCRKAQSTSEIVTVPPPPPIIADVDLYKHDPWQLPEMALFGTTEWYFFTPRDRKYPNGSRPNRATGNGYWKATGADKHIKSKSDPNTTIGIKKSLVFYAGKGIKGIKTNWIMHEYRLVAANPNTISTPDDWVLCRLYNKKNNPKEMIMSNNDNIHHNQDLHRTSPLDESHKENSCSNNDESFDSFEYSDGESLTKVKGTGEQINTGLMDSLMKTDDDWLECLSLEDLHHCLEAMPPNHAANYLSPKPTTFF